MIQSDPPAFALAKAHSRPGSRGGQPSVRLLGAPHRRILVAGWWPRGMKHRARSHGELGFCFAGSPRSKRRCCQASQAKAEAAGFEMRAMSRRSGRPALRGSSRLLSEPGRPSERTALQPLAGVRVTPGPGGNGQLELSPPTPLLLRPPSPPTLPPTAIATPPLPELPPASPSPPPKPLPPSLPPPMPPVQPQPHRREPARLRACAPACTPLQARARALPPPVCGLRPERRRARGRGSGVVQGAGWARTDPSPPLPGPGGRTRRQLASAMHSSAALATAILGRCSV